MSHTPAPWTAEPGVGKGAWIKGADGNWSALACGEDEATGIANARLIAAAPDLLSAAKRALNVLKATGESVRPGNALGALDAAIAKVEGRS